MVAAPIDGQYASLIATEDPQTACGTTHSINTIAV